MRHKTQQNCEFKSHMIWINTIKLRNLVSGFYTNYCNNNNRQHHTLNQIRNTNDFGPLDQLVWQNATHDLLEVVHYRQIRDLKLQEPQNCIKNDKHQLVRNEHFNRANCN